LLEGYKFVNRRETHIMERDEALKQIEKELQDVKMNVEKEHSTLKEKEAEVRTSLAALMTQEEVHILLALSLFMLCSYVHGRLFALLKFIFV